MARRIVWSILMVLTLPVIVVAGGGGDDLGTSDVLTGVVLQLAAVVAVAVVYLNLVTSRVGIDVAGVLATACLAAGYAASVWADDEQTGDAALLGVIAALVVIGVTAMIERRRAGGVPDGSHQDPN